MPFGIGHDRFVDVFNSRSGAQLTSMEIKKKVQGKYPHLKLGSIIPTDHDDARNKGECRCAGTGREVFRRLGRNSYQVR